MSFMTSHPSSRLCHRFASTGNIFPIFGKRPVCALLSSLQFSAFMHDLRGFSAAKSRDLVDKSFSEAISTCKGDKVSRGTT